MNRFSELKYPTPGSKDSAHYEQALSQGREAFQKKAYKEGDWINTDEACKLLGIKKTSFLNKVYAAIEIYPFVILNSVVCIVMNPRVPCMA